MKSLDHQIKVYCKICKEPHNIEVNYQDYIDWRTKGKFIQSAFPYVSADKRELLISGICGTCFDKMFGSEDE